MDPWLEWMNAHPVTTAAIVIYLVANLIPRPHPDERTGWQKTLWTIVDRLSVLTAKALPGRLKMLLKRSPPPLRQDDTGRGQDEKEPS